MTRNMDKRINIKKKEIIASGLVVLFVIFYLVVSVREFFATGATLFSGLQILGVALLMLQLAVMPNMLFLPFRDAMKEELTPLFLPRNMVSLLGTVAVILLGVGFVGDRF